MNINAAVNRIEELFPSTAVFKNEPMKNHTTFRIGGCAAALVEPCGADDFEGIISFLKNENIRYMIVGNGSNLLFSDDKLDMIIVKTQNKLCDIKLVSDTEIYAEAGALLSKIAAFAQQNGLSGMEFAHGIPGTLGGAAVMNAGAYGGEMRDIITRVVTCEGEFENKDCGFSYRRSRFEDGSCIIGAYIGLQKGDKGEIKVKMDELAAKRRNSQPLTLPSAGSTFKRPQTGYAAAMIDGAGLKGYAVGGAMVSEKHAGFVVNCGSASFSDVMAVIDHVKQTVFEKYGTMLEPEVKIIK